MSGPKILAMVALVLVAMVVLPVAFVLMVRHQTGGDHGPDVEVAVSITHRGDRTVLTQELRAVSGDLPQRVELLLPDRIQTRSTPAYRYLSATDGTGQVLDLVAVPERFGHRIEPRRTDPRTLSVTVEVADDPAGPGAPSGRLAGVVPAAVEVRRLPPGWLCLTQNGSGSPMQFRRCAVQGSVVGPGNSLSNLRWRGPGTTTPTVNDQGP